MPPMRPVDHVEQRRVPQAGFLFHSTGWKDWILGVLFSTLIVCSAVVGIVADPTWWTWWLQGTVILALVLAANAALKRWVAR